jgi:integrase
MSALRVEYDPLLDKTYQSTRLGRDVVDFLAWKKMGGAAARTLEQYERDLARGCLMFPNHGLEEFGDSEMLHVAAAFKDGERRYRCAAWKSFYKWALRTRRVTVNPTDVLPEMAQAKQKVIDVFTDEEISILEDLPIRDGALMQLLFDSGLRKAEARNFRLLHLRANPAPGEVVVLKGKGGKDRVIPATLAVSQRVNELAVLDGLRPSDFLWYTRPGGGSKIAREKPANDTSFDTWWRRCIKASGVRYRNPHTTRHTFATRWLRRGGRITTLSTAMGHSSLAITYDLYGHLDTRDLVADLALIEGQL